MPSKKNYNSRFPPARIKKIMQMDEEVGKVAAPVPVIISRVLEMFVEHILKSAGMLAEESHCRTLLSSHLSQALAGEERLHFLMETVRQHCKSEVPGGHEETPSAVSTQRGAPPPPPPAAVVGGVETVDCTPAKAAVPDALGAAAMVNVDRGGEGGRGGGGRGGEGVFGRGGRGGEGGGRGGRGRGGRGAGGSSPIGPSEPARGERGRGKPRGRPCKRSVAATPAAAQTHTSVPIKRSRGRPRKNVDLAPTSFPIPILLSPSSSGTGAPSAPSTGGITFSIGGSAPTTPLTGGIGLPIPALSTTCTPAIAGVSISIPGFSFPSPSTPDPPSPVDAVSQLDQRANQYKSSAVTFSTHSPLGRPLIATPAVGKGVNVAFGCPSTSPVAGVTLCLDASSPCSDNHSAKNDLSLSDASSSLASGLKVSFGGQACREAAVELSEKENSSVNKEKTPRLAASVASLAVEKSLDQIKIEVPTHFSYTSGSDSPGVITSSVAHSEERSCISSKSSPVTDMEVSVVQVDKKNNEVSSANAESSLKKHIDVKFGAESTAVIIKKETKNSSRLKENDSGKLVKKDSSSIKSGISLINGSSPKDGEGRFWGCQAPPPLPALYSCSGMFMSSRVEDNSDEDYDN